MLTVPQTYEEAINLEDSQRWKVAMDAEMQTLKQKNTYDLVTFQQTEQKQKENGCTL